MEQQNQIQPELPEPSRKSRISTTLERELPPRVDAAEFQQVDESLRRAILAAIGSNEWPILIFGSQGRGKTSAMAAFYQHWRTSPDGRARWYSLPDLLQEIMRCRQEGGFIYDHAGCQVFESQMFERVETAELVCIDDVGTRALSDAQYEAFLAILNRRQHKPTILTSNLSPKELGSLVDMRVASRLCAGTMIELKGQDRRLAGKRIITCG